jgi:hypothetical protein
MQPMEMISPILKGTEGLNQVAAVVAALRSMGGRVNSSCGFHVHVGFPAEEDVRTLVRLIFLTAQNEDALYAATGLPARKQSTYAKSIRRSYQGCGAVSDFNALRRKCRAAGYDRMHVLNLTNLLGGSAKRTVEFRVFTGTLNITKIKGYVQLCLGLLQYSSEETRRVRWNVQPNIWTARVFPGMGEGELAVMRLFGTLGWARTYSRHQRPVRGVLDPESLTAAKTILLQLGRKFDGGPRRATDVNPDGVPSDAVSRRVPFAPEPPVVEPTPVPPSSDDIEF